jgi:L-alanine-DL-glutamate epimerase-like enolase superfamily enzyme
VTTPPRATTPVSTLDVSAFTVPLEAPESDGTLTWEATTVVVAEAVADGTRGLGFTYGTPACATLIRDVLVPKVVGVDALDVPRAWDVMVRSIRNVGRPGVASMAIAAVDVALWDLKSKLLGQSLVRLLGARRDRVPVYASGGFTSFTEHELVEQMATWVRVDGFSRVKMKIGIGWGSDERADLNRVARVREAIGQDAELYVDGNGAFTAKQAVRLCRPLFDEGVTWFEEPVSSDDLDGLRAVRRSTGIDIAAGEYGYDLAYFERMCRADAVDVLQVDVSRCAGITEWLRATSVAAAYGLQVSAHTAQSLHAPVATAVPNLRHLEYFHDHARVDRILFDGVLEPDHGFLVPDPSRPGLGLELKRQDAERYAA